MSETSHAVVADPDQSLNYRQTIDRKLVHRSSIHEVFITDTSMADADTCLVGAQLPRRHALYSDRVRDSYDPLLMLEICRQASIAMAHRYFGVPPDWAFVLGKVQVTIQRPELLLVTAEPADLVIAVRVRRKLGGGDFFGGAILTHAITLGDETVARVQGTMKCMSRDEYLPMRAAARRSKDLHDPFHTIGTVRLAASELGRHDPRNVVITDSVDDERRLYPVTVDPTHPVLFDHQLDHVPGSLLIEASRQASFRHVTTHARRRVALSSWDVAGFKTDFTEFAEIGSPLYCRVTAADFADSGRSAEVGMEVLQGSETLGRTALSWVSD